MTTSGFAEGSTPDDIDALAVRARAGDRDALEELLRVVRPRALNVCRSVLPYRADAEDACQEALISISAKIGSWGGRGRFTTWMHIVALNAARTTYRRMKNQAPATDVVHLERPDPRTTSVIAGTRLDLLEAIESLERDHPQYVQPLLLRQYGELTYEDLLARQLSEAWVTLNCVSNPVGGSLIGNAWWSGVRIADILAQAGVDPRADALLQTSVDGWTCGTPLSALTDGRDALLAVGMNGQALPIEHGFPVRSIVPGLYGFVSACKWVVDLEVTRFDRFDAYWTERGWAEQAPVRLASRIDVPRSGDAVAAGAVRVGGVAWEQHVGIDAVEVAVDGGAWQPAEVAALPTDDTWVQWAATVTLEPGEHLIRVRATDKSGLVQTGVQRDVVPDGATGWHTVDVTAQ